MASTLPAAVQSQYDALTEGVGLADFSDRTQIELTGKDRASFLHNLCTNEIKKLSPGSGCEAFLTNVQGKILAHVLVFCRADSLVLETVPGQAEAIMSHLDRYLIREDVQLLDRSVAWCELLVAGKKSIGLLRQLVSADPPAELAHHLDAEMNSVNVSIRRIEITRPVCYLVSAPAGNLASVAAALEQAGATRCGAGVLEMARIEAGWPLYGLDITDKNLPQEVNRDAKAISFTKGCYLGQETVARIDALGHVNRMLVRVRFSALEIPAAGTPLIADDKTVGQVTSAAYSPQLAAPLALAYVRREFHAAGTRLTCTAGEAEVL